MNKVAKLFSAPPPPWHTHTLPHPFSIPVIYLNLPLISAGADQLNMWFFILYAIQLQMATNNHLYCQPFGFYCICCCPMNSQTKMRSNIPRKLKITLLFIYVLLTGEIGDNYQTKITEGEIKASCRVGWETVYQTTLPNTAQLFRSGRRNRTVQASRLFSLERIKGKRQWIEMCLCVISNVLSALLALGQHDVTAVCIFGLSYVTPAPAICWFKHLLLSLVFVLVGCLRSLLLSPTASVWKHSR